MVAMRKVYLVPLFAFIIAPATFVITYIMAVLYGHVYPVFPYISETGSIAPESCLFAQFLNIASFLMSIAIYVKYRQVIEFSRLRPSRAISSRRNMVAAVLGALSCLGLDIVANFQESNVLSVHMIGAGLCFISGTAYFCMQTSISRNMCPEVCSQRTVAIRTLLCVLCVLLAITTAVPGVISILKFTGDNRRKWTAEDGGYEWHLVSTISEWLLVLFFCSFILSYVLEFRKIVIDRPIIRITNIDHEIMSETATTNGVKTIEV